MNFALVDDEKQLMDELHEMLVSELSVMGMGDYTIEMFSSGEQLLSAFTPGRFDVAILDIYMESSMTGVELARKIRKLDSSVSIVFCTSSNEFASESYEVGAVYYLKKPVMREKLSAMLTRLDLARIKRNRAVTLPDGERCLLRNILHTDYANHTVTFFMSDGTQRVYRMSHASAAALLHSYSEFHSVGQGSIVNFAQVVKMTPEGFLLKDGTVLYVPRRRYKDLQAEYSHYHFNKLREEVAE